MQFLCQNIFNRVKHFFFLEIRQNPLGNNEGLMNQTPTPDKSRPYRYKIRHINSVFSVVYLNFWLFSSSRYLDSYSIVYYFKESIKRKKDIQCQRLKKNPV